MFNGSADIYKKFYKVFMNKIQLGFENSLK